MSTEPLDVLILNALIARLKGSAANGLSDVTTPPTPLAFPLVTFSPSLNTPYIDARPILRATPQNLSITFGQSVLFRGIFQIDAVVPDGQGEAVGLRLAVSVAARFPEGTTLLAGSNKINLNSKPAIAAAVKDAPWVRYPVSIPYLVIA